MNKGSIVSNLRIVLAITICAGTLSSAHALDAGGAKQVIDKFLAGQNSEQGTADAFTHAIADVNADGRADIVLLWHVMGPTSAWPKLTLFLDAGRSYRALTADLTGQVEKLAVKGPDILIDTLTLGPRDPRCCPTVKKQVQMRWQGGKLVQLK